MKRYHFGRWKLCIVGKRRFPPELMVVERSLVATGRKDAADADASPSCSHEARRWNEATASAASLLLKATVRDNHASSGNHSANVQQSPWQASRLRSFLSDRWIVRKQSNTDRRQEVMSVQLERYCMFKSSDDGWYVQSSGHRSKFVRLK